MFEFIGILFICIAIITTWFAVKSPNVFKIFSATLCLFSIGYYALPLMLPSLSGLRNISERDLNAVAGMSFTYLICLLSGVWIISLGFKRLPGLYFHNIDRFSASHWWTVTTIAAGTYITYLLTTDLTWYSAEDPAAFVEDRSGFAGLIGFVGNFSLAVFTVSVAVAIQQRRLLRITVALLILAFVEFRLASGAQRLLFITPIFMVFVSLVGARQYRVAASALVTGVLALLLISPFAVALREARAGADRNIKSIGVSYDQGFLATTLQSIVDRSDLIYNMTFLKAYVDEHGYAGPLFYKSVLMIPIPRVLLSDKPAVLSDTGRIDGEASVLAWRLIMGDSLGSLTAFGSIVAYREGGWLAVILDGVAAGMMFAFCLGVSARSGYIGLTFLPLAFVTFAVAKSPTSFFEGLSQILTYLPILLGFWLLEAGVSLAIRRAVPVKRRGIVSPLSRAR